VGIFQTRLMMLKETRGACRKLSTNRLLGLGNFRVSGRNEKSSHTSPDPPRAFKSSGIRGVSH
jgi:hypothetical protein